MKNLLSKLGFLEKKYTWEDFEGELKFLFLKKIAIIVGIIILAILTFVFSVPLMSSLVVLAIAVIYAIYTLYLYLSFLYGNFYCKVGTVTEVTQKSHNNLLLKGSRNLSTSYVVMDDGTQSYRINTPRAGNYHKNSEIAVYMLSERYYESTANQKIIPNPIAISIVKAAS